MCLLVIENPDRILVEAFRLHVHSTCVGLNCQRKTMTRLVEYSLKCCELSISSAVKRMGNDILEIKGSDRKPKKIYSKD